MTSGISVRRFATAISIGTVMTTPVVAQTAPTTGRSLDTLTRVTVRSPGGKRLMLGARIEPDRPTLIAFWASWCLPCMAEAPHLASLRRQFGRRFNFVFINRRDGEPDLRQPPVSIAQFLARAEMTDADYVTADASAYRRIVGADMATIPAGIVGIPRVYLFDRQGRQVYTAMGFSETRSADLEQRLEEVLATR